MRSVIQSTTTVNPTQTESGKRPVCCGKPMRFIGTRESTSALGTFKILSDVFVCSVDERHMVGAPFRRVDVDLSDKLYKSASVVQKPSAAAPKLPRPVKRRLEGFGSGLDEV